MPTDAQMNGSGSTKPQKSLESLQKTEMDPTSGSASEAESTADEGRPDGTQSKKRKRSNKISCELCKLRKVKCDKAEPA